MPALIGPWGIQLHFGQATMRPFFGFQPKGGADPEKAKQEAEENLAKAKAAAAEICEEDGVKSARDLLNKVARVFTDYGFVRVED